VPERLTQRDIWFRIPAGRGQSELEIKRSVFIGTAGLARNVAEAEAFIQEIKTTYPDASHNAWAYLIRPEPRALFGSSDDGEPGGTAGRPMLSVLQGSGLRQVVVVGTRYFGGIKLGTGGLVRAYSAAARGALANLPTRWMLLHRRTRIRVDYHLYGQLRYLLPQMDIIIENELFDERVSLELAVPWPRTSETRDLLMELTNGRVDLEKLWLDERYLPVSEEKLPASQID